MIAWCFDMRILKEKDVFDLRKDGKISGEGSKKIESALFSKKARPEVSAEERQAKILENIVKAMTLMSQSLDGNDKNAEILLEMVRKFEGIENIKMPEAPKAWTKLKLTPERDRDGFITEIIAEKI